MATSSDSEFLFLDHSLFGNVDVLPRRLDTCWIGRTNRSDEAIQMCHCERLEKARLKMARRMTYERAVVSVR